MNEPIDLCSSSDEDDSVPQVCNNRNIAPRVRVVIDSSDDSSDDDNVTTSQYTFTNTTNQKKSIVTPEDTKQKQSKQDGVSSNDDDEHDDKNTKKKPRTLFTSSISFNKTIATWDSSSDSDDDTGLLDTKIGLARKKNSVPSKAVKTKAVPSTSIEPPIEPTISSTSSSTSTVTTKKSINPYYGSTNRQTTNRQTTLPFGMTKTTASETAGIYPTLAHTRQYEDVRASYILAFWKYAQTLVHASYNFPRLDSFCRKITALAFSDFPIRSLEEYCHRFAKTNDLQSIQEALRVGNVTKIKPSSSNKEGTYYSIAEACLVTLVCHVERRAHRNLESRNLHELRSFLQEKESWMFLSDLIPEIDVRLKDACPGRLTRHSDIDNGATYYTDPSTRSAEYKQIEKLQMVVPGEDCGYIKFHRQKGQLCVELTTLGYRMVVEKIRNRFFPEVSGHYRTSNLFAVDSRYENICLAVDCREGGGPKRRLHFMCNKLDTLKIPYIVYPLHIGDYAFFVTDNGNECNSTSKLCPILIERKSIQDVAQSIFDGRWKDQKRRMYQGQYVFGYENCRLAYIIEGKEQAHQLTSGHIGQRQFNVSREQLDEEIKNLQADGFAVLRTNTPDHSMVELSKWATQVLRDYRDGKLNAQYTYGEFQRKVNQIPRHVDFAKIAKDRAADQVVPPKAINTSSQDLDKKQMAAKTNPFRGWKLTQLQSQCVAWGLAKTGKKADLIARLNGPRPPQVWIDRKARDIGYVPARHNTCATALLVGLFLEQRKAGPAWKGLTKEELYSIAERLNISKDPFSGVAASGPYQYDGWSSMSDLRSGEIPLVVFKKGRFKLTTTCDVAGYALAEGMHEWCHAHNNCSCGDIV